MNTLIDTVLAEFDAQIEAEKSVEPRSEYIQGRIDGVDTGRYIAEKALTVSDPKEIVVVELNDLVAKLEKLDTFIGSSLFNNINPRQQALMKKQYMTMIELKGVLELRLQHWE